MNRYCRTCLEFITGLGYFSIDETIPSCSIPVRQQLQTCIPGIDMNIIGNAFICSACATSLAHAHQFYEKCMRSEAKIREIVQKTELVNKEETQVFAFEQHHIKTEQLQVDLNTEIDLDAKSHGVSYGHGRYLYTEETENCNDVNEDLIDSAKFSDGDLMDTKDFRVDETENCDGSYKGDSIKFSNMRPKIKPKLSKQEIAIKKSEAAKARLDKIKCDPVLWAEYKQKERLKYLRKKEKGQRKCVKDMTSHELRQARKNWKNYSSNYREKQAKNRVANSDNTPLASHAENNNTSSIPLENRAPELPKNDINNQNMKVDRSQVEA